MGIKKQVRLASLLITMALGAVVLFGWGHFEAGISQAGGSPGAMAVDCNAGEAGVQDSCIHAPGSTFQIEVHVTDIPLQQGSPAADGFQAFQAKLSWSDGDVLTYNPTVAPSAEVVWPATDTDGNVLGCFAARAPLADDPTEVVSGCQLEVPALSADTGPVLTFEFTCSSAPNAMSPPAGLDSDQSLFTLIPREGDTQGGTHMTDLQNAEIDPTLAGATVTCGEGQEPTPTPVIPFITTDDPDDTIEPGGSTVLTATFADAGLDCTWSIVSQPEGSNATLSDEGDTTDANGEVTATLNVGDKTGTVQVEATCGGESVVLDVTVEPSGITEAGISGPIDASGFSAGLWAVIGSLLAATAVATAAFGWKAARITR